MSKIFILPFCIFLLQFIEVNAQVKTPGKHALIVAIANYPVIGGWGTIHSLNDVGPMQRLLKKQDFPEANVHVLRDAEATSAGIKQALTDLIANVKAGDVVVIHVSSHGEQIEDDNGDEADGLDEAIVSFDAVSPSKSKNFYKDSANYFRDDKFGKYMMALRRKLGREGDLVVFMDACHSGSGTRGSNTVRGGQSPFVSKNFEPGKFTNDTAGVFQERTVGNDDLATYVVFSAAIAEQLAMETRDENDIEIGSLTYALSRVFEDLDPGATYRTVFSKIRSVMNTKVKGQLPVMEGNGIDRKLFGGSFVHQKPYVEIAEIVSSKTINLNAGIFSGLNTGAKVLLYPSGTVDPSKSSPLDSGIVSKGFNFTSTVILSNGNIQDPGDAWVFVTEPAFNIDPLRIGFLRSKDAAKGFTEPEILLIKERLKDFSLVSWEGKPDLILKKGKGKDSLIVTSNGYFFSTVANGSEEELKAKIEQYAGSRFLQELAFTDTQYLLEITLVPMINDKAETSLTASKIRNGRYHFTEGDAFTFLVKNNGSKDVFLNVLDIQPDGIINAILPNRAQEVYARDLKIKAGETRLFNNYKINLSKPYGTEIFKIFISDRLIDMEALATTRGDVPKGNFGPLEKLVKRSFDATRGGNVVMVGNTDGSIYDLVFEIEQE